MSSVSPWGGLGEPGEAGVMWGGKWEGDIARGSRPHEGGFAKKG